LSVANLDFVLGSEYSPGLHTALAYKGASLCEAFEEAVWLPGWACVGVSDALG
jgi:hypothetical protein